VNFSAGSWVADAASCLRKYARNTARPFSPVVPAVFQGADAAVVGGAAESRLTCANACAPGSNATASRHLHAELAHRDPVSAERLKPPRPDPHRRALE